MKTWHLIVASLMLATAGCRSDPAIAILERELRLKEDEVYRLQATVEDLRDSQQCHERTMSRSRSEDDDREQSTLRRRSGPGTKPPTVELPSKPRSEVPDTLKGPSDGLPPGLEVPEHLRGPSKPLNPKDSAPSVPPPKPTADRSSLPPLSEPDGPSLEKDAGVEPSRPRRMAMASRTVSSEPFTPGGDSRRVAGIVLNRTLTGGIGDENRPGDQGLLVVVEPRDRAGRLVDAPAEMSVVVIDPLQEGNAARVARWDFTAAEVASMFRRTNSGGAIHLTTAWPGEPPAHNKLRLFVRYVTADGRKLQADVPIEVALPGDKTARWNPAEAASRDEQPRNHREALESRRPDDTPVANAPPPAPRAAARPDDSQSRRPVWSPERRF